MPIALRQGRRGASRRAGSSLGRRSWASAVRSATLWVSATWAPAMGRRSAGGARRQPSGLSRSTVVRPRGHDQAARGRFLHKHCHVARHGAPGSDSPRRPRVPAVRQRAATLLTQGGSALEHGNAAKAVRRSPNSIGSRPRVRAEVHTTNSSATEILGPGSFASMHAILTRLRRRSMQSIHTSNPVKLSVQNDRHEQTRSIHLTVRMLHQNSTHASRQSQTALSSTAARAEHTFPSSTKPLIPVPRRAPGALVRRTQQGHCDEALFWMEQRSVASALTKAASTPALRSAMDEAAGELQGKKKNKNNF